MTWRVGISFVFLQRMGMFRLELAVGCTCIRSAGAFLCLKLRDEVSSVVTRDCDTCNLTGPTVLNLRPTGGSPGLGIAAQVEFKGNS